MAISDINRHGTDSMARTKKSKTNGPQKRPLGTVLKPEQVQWIELKIASKGWNKTEFYAAYKSANQGKPLARNPERQIQRIFQERNPLPLSPTVKANLAATLGMKVEEFEEGLRESLIGTMVLSNDAKRSEAERRWQYILRHPIQGIEILVLLKLSVGFEWFHKILDDTRITFSRQEKTVKLSEILSASPAPNTVERSQQWDKPTCAFWELYEPESGYWFRKITPTARPFSVIAGFDAEIPWSFFGISKVTSLGDLALLTEVGISISAQAFQAGIEDVVLRFVGETFSFHVRLSEHGRLEALHEFARVQYTTVKSADMIPLGTSFSGMQLLEMFREQFMPRAKEKGAKTPGGIAGMTGPDGQAISFHPFMPKTFMKSPQAADYTFKLSVPEKVDLKAEAESLKKELVLMPDSEKSARLASIYAHEGRLQEALECLANAIKHTPSARIHGLMGETLEMLGRFDEALNHLQTATILAGKNDAQLEAAVNNKMGACLQKLKQHESSLARFEAAVRLQPMNPQYHWNYGLALVTLGRQSEAVSPWQRAVDLMPEHAESAMSLGILLNLEGQKLKAAHYLEKATRLAPNSAEVHEAFGTYLAQTGQHAQAIPTFKRAIAIKENARLHELLAASLAQLDQWPEAEDASRRAVELKPDDPEKLVNLAVCLSHLEKPEEVIDLCQRAVKLNETSRAYGLLASSFCETGRWQEAESAFRRSLDLDCEGNRPEILVNLAVTLVQLERTDEALKLLEQAVCDNPNNDMLQHNLKLLRKDLGKE